MCQMTLQIECMDSQFIGLFSCFQIKVQTPFGGGQKMMWTAALRVSADHKPLREATLQVGIWFL